jgi:hypothetical protein
MGGKLTLSAPDNLVYDGSSKSVKITWDGYIKSYLTNAFTSTITYEIKDKNGSYVPLNSEPTKVGDYRATYKLTVISNADEDDMDSTSGSTTYSAYVEYSIVQAAEAPNKPSSELTPAHTVKTVSEVELPSGWQWSEGSGSEALADNTSVTATAKYAGADAGNYEIESVEITIIRQPCSHKGGTATCVSGATCENCGTEYTDKNAANHTGNTGIINAKSETCTENGYTGDTICSDCETILESGTEIKATGHTGGTATCASGAICENCGTEYTDKNAANHTGNTEIINAKAATCTEDGYTGDKICSDCKKVLESGAEISATGHTGGTATCTEQATCTACGKPYGELTAHTGGTATCVNGAKCENCGTEYTDKNAANHTGNTEIISAKSETCTENGYTGDTICSDCKKVLESGTEIKAAGHTGGTATCTEQAACTICGNPYGGLIAHTGGMSTCTEQAICTICGKPYGELAAHTGGTATCVSGAKCENCGTEYTDKNAANHTGNTEIISAKAATCTENGYTGDTICLDCKTVLGSGTEIKAIGHTGGTATCTEQATCTACGKPYGELTAHVGGTATCVNGAICTICGKPYGGLIAHTGGTATCASGAICENCGTEYTDKNAANHTGNTEIINAKAATCTESGYTGDKICSDCKTVLESGTETKAAGHTGGTATCTAQAICTAGGKPYGELTAHAGGTATCASGAICETCGTEYTDKNAANHTGNTEIINAKAATCTEDGYTGDKICSDCKTVLGSGTEISATGHTGGTATCAEQAKCEICGKPYGELIAHTGGTATCAIGAICENCGTEYTELLAHSYVAEVTKTPSATEEGIRTYTCENCGHSYTESIPKIESPYIEGEDGVQGWDAIRQKTSAAIEEALANPGKEKTVTVLMNGEVTVPGDIFTQIKGQNVTIVFDMGDGIKWSVDGKSVVNDSISDINFGIYTDEKANTIPSDIMADVINNVTGRHYTANLTLAYDGEFGFTAVMSIGLDAENAGYYANLFYYNKTDSRLDFVCADRIAADGTAKLAFTHASDYTIVIEAESLDPNAAPSEEPTTEPTTAKPTTEPTTTAKPTTEPTTEPTTAKPTTEPTTTKPTTAKPTTEPTTTAAATTETPATAASTAEAAAESPKTGDKAKAPLAVLLMLISEIGVAVCVMPRRKKN